MCQIWSDIPKTDFVASRLVYEQPPVVIICLTSVGAGVSLLLIPAAVTINEEFTDRRTVAMGIASSGGGVGSIILPQFTLWCVDTYGWAGAFVLLGGICLQGVIACGLLYSGNSSKTKQKDTHTMPGRSDLKYPVMMRFFHC